MDPFEYMTWNPQLHFQVLRGGPVGSGDEMRGRTLRFKLVDRSSRLDEIEWHLDNSDGMMTRPEYLALGVIVRVRLGYSNGTNPWRTFLINRVRGGAGVFGRGRAAVGEGDAEIVYAGRNRNAKTSKIYKKSKLIQGPTADISQLDFMLASGASGFVPGATTSDVVRLIAAQNGFTGPWAHIQDTADTIEGHTIPLNMPAGVFLQRQARRFDFIFKVDGKGLHWHSKAWSKQEDVVKRTYQYGASSLIKLSIDGDYRLPVPGSLKTVGIDPDRGRVRVANAEGAPGYEAGQGAAKGLSKMGLSSPEAQTHLVRDYILPVTAAGETASVKAQAIYVSQHTNKFHLKLTVVGDPEVMALDSIVVAGVGTPLVDGKWQVIEAVHDFPGEVYQTILTVRRKPKTVISSRERIRVAGAEGAPALTAGQGTGVGVKAYIKAAAKQFKVGGERGTVF